MVDETTQFLSSISNDGYTVYRMFDGEYSKMLHLGCWMHSRRSCVNGLTLAGQINIIGPIGDMFRNEGLYHTMKLKGEQIKEKDLSLQNRSLNVSTIRWS